MNSFLLNRAFGSVDPRSFEKAQTTRLIHHLEPAPGIRFSNERLPARQQASPGTNWDEPEFSSKGPVAHGSGVSCLTIDLDGRYMISGGVDPTIHLWDLETRGSELNHVYRSQASVSNSSRPNPHQHTITSLSIYPFDPEPSTILSTSHDGTLKLSSLQSPQITPVHTFPLGCTPYTHSFPSLTGSFLSVAVGTSERAVRLVDLRSGLATHGLPGHNGAVLSVEWAPHRPWLLASGSVDNKAIIFDIRRGGHNSAVAVMDMDDPTGLVIPESWSEVPRAAFLSHQRAHNGAVTGVRWSSDGSHLVTAGQDSRIRVWDTTTGANTLVHFGPRVRNATTSNLAERAPLVIPKSYTTSGNETLIWPNFYEHNDRGDMLMLEIHGGTLIKQLKVPGLATGAQTRRPPSSTSAARINALAWRGNGASGEGLEMFSGHGDGKIRSWVSQEEEEEPTEAEEAAKRDSKRKRDVLDDVYRGFFEGGPSRVWT